MIRLYYRGWCGGDGIRARIRVVISLIIIFVLGAIAMQELDKTISPCWGTSNQTCITHDAHIKRLSQKSLELLTHSTSNKSRRGDNFQELGGRFDGNFHLL